MSDQTNQIEAEIAELEAKLAAANETAEIAELESEEAAEVAAEQAQEVAAPAATSSPSAVRRILPTGMFQTPQEGSDHA